MSIYPFYTLISYNIIIRTKKIKVIYFGKASGSLPPSLRRRFRRRKIKRTNT